MYFETLLVLLYFHFDISENLHPGEAQRPRRAGTPTQAVRVQLAESYMSRFFFFVRFFCSCYRRRSREGVGFVLREKQKTIEAHMNHTGEHVLQF